MVFKKDRVFLVVLLMVSLAACTKKRKEEFAQGQGGNGLVIKEAVESWRHVIKTKDNISKPHLKVMGEKLKKKSRLDTTATTTKRTQKGPLGQKKSKTSKRKDLDKLRTHVNLKDYQNTYNQFDLVGWESDSPFIPEELPMRGRENYTYHVVYKISDKYLVVYKVGRLSDLPFEERTYAQEISEGLVGIPLLGYPLEHIKVENKRDPNRKNTSEMMEIKVGSSSESQYIRFDKTKYVLFEAITKNDVYPVSLFHHFNINDQNSLWYYSFTILDASEGDELLLGHHWSMMNQLRHSPSFKVRLRAFENEIRVENAVIDPQIRSQSPVDNQHLLTIPNVEFFDYKTQKIPETKDLAELKELEDTSRNWQDRQYVKMDFSKLEDLYFKNKFGQQSGVIDQIFIDDNYFSVTILYIKNESQFKVKYSFLKAPSHNNYKKIISQKKDEENFHYFSHRPPYMNNYFETQKEKENSYYVLRQNPEQNVYQYYLEKGTDKNHIHLIENSIKYINQSFSFMKSSKRLELVRDTKTNDYMYVEPGDIRYNTINLRYDQHKLMPYGAFASLLFDQESGEIVSSHISFPIKQAIKYNELIVKQYIRSQLNLLRSGDQLVVGPLSMPSASHTSSSHQNMTMASLNAFMKGEVFDPKKVELNQGEVTKRGAEASLFSNASVQTNCQSSQQQMTFRFNLIQKYCGSEDSQANVLSLVEAYKNKKVHFETEFQPYSVIEKCAQKIAGPYLEYTMTHEFLHTLGLSHNFLASLDRGHYFDDSLYSHYDYEPPAENKDEKYKTASVMDYLNPIDQAPFPGYGDINTLGFLYENRVQTKSKTYASIHHKSSVKSQLGEQMEEFLTCDDEFLDTNKNPLCLKRDRGETPLEIVENLSQEMMTHFKMNRFRWGQSQFLDQEQLTSGLIYNYLYPMRVIYNQWRYELSKKMGSPMRYLPGMTVEKMNYDLKPLLASEEKVGPMSLFTLSQWKEAADFIKNFYLEDLVMMSDRYCVLQPTKAPTNGGSEYVLRELNELRRSSLKRVENCTDLKEDFVSQGYQLVDDIGYELEEDYFSPENRRNNENNDVAGSGRLRSYAMALMSIRGLYYNDHYHMPYSGLAVNDDLRSYDFMPNFLDEPDFREKVSRTLVNRYVEGVPFSVDGRSYRSVKFSHEKTLLTHLHYYYMLGLRLPGNLNEELRRKKPFYFSPVVGSGDGVPIEHYDDDWVINNPAAYYSLDMLQHLKNVNLMIEGVRQNSLPPLEGVVQGLLGFDKLVKACYHNHELPPNREDVSRLSVIRVVEWLEHISDLFLVDPSQMVSNFDPTPLMIENRLVQDFVTPMRSAIYSSVISSVRSKYEVKTLNLSAYPFKKIKDYFEMQKQLQSSQDNTTPSTETPPTAAAATENTRLGFPITAQPQNVDYSTPRYDYSPIMKGEELKEMAQKDDNLGKMLQTYTPELLQVLSGRWVDMGQLNGETPFPLSLQTIKEMNCEDLEKKVYRYKNLLLNTLNSLSVDHVNEINAQKELLYEILISYPFHDGK